jgi:hypothetical protein
MSDADIVNVAFRRGGQRIVATMGDNATPQLRGSILGLAGASAGGAVLVADAIVSLFPNSEGVLSDNQIGVLADHLVENFKP